MNTIYAVITGDIVGSASIDKEDREDFLHELKASFEEMNETLLHEDPLPFEIFRGDSFQVILKKPELSLVISLLIRARLRSLDMNKTEKKNIDARLAIGIGSIGFSTEKIIESDGQAFQFSGRDFDNMKKTDSRLRVQTPWEEVNSEMAVVLSFADATISHWTASQAEAFYHYLLRNEKQQTLAERLNVSQPAIHKRLVAGNLECIDLLRIRFENLISSKL